jgi:glycosyltransferase involved in cell wall biosynthesis
MKKRKTARHLKSPKFSVCVIARNEQKTLPRLVASLNEFQKRGGEIIVLDTGSKDATAEIARNLGCRVVEVGEKFKITITEGEAEKINAAFIVKGEEHIVKADDTLFDFASARNYAATFSSRDMIAMPDCDEIYTRLDIDAINEAIKCGYTQFEYDFIYAHDDDGNPTVQFKHSKFYNRKNQEWKGVIHEVLSGASNLLKLEAPIIKLEHYQNVETNRGGYLVGLAYDYARDQDNDRNAHYFARELYYCGRYRSAIALFRKHIQMGRWPTEASQSWVYIGDCFMALGERSKGLMAYAAAYDLEPNRREPLMRIAELYYRERKYQQALTYAMAALQITGIDCYANYQPYYSYLPHEIMYDALYNLGFKNRAHSHYTEALRLYPQSTKIKEDAVFFKDIA